MKDLEVGLDYVINTAKEVTKLAKRSRHGVDKEYVDRAIQLLQEQINALTPRLNADDVDESLSDSDEIGSTEDVMRDDIVRLTQEIKNLREKRLAPLEAKKATKGALKTIRLKLNKKIEDTKTEIGELKRQIDDVSSMAKANKENVEDIASRLEELTKRVDAKADAENIQKLTKQVRDACTGGDSTNSQKVKMLIMFMDKQICRYAHRLKVAEGSVRVFTEQMTDIQATLNTFAKRLTGIEAVNDLRYEEIKPLKVGEGDDIVVDDVTLATCMMSSQ